MFFRALAGAFLILCLLAGTRASAAGDAAPLFRVFLKDGTSLVSYGEFARVGDRVVFSMPTAAIANPPLHLMDLAADRVDWDRTDRYAAAVRETHYVQTQAEKDYAALSNSVSQTLNQVAITTDPKARLSIVERARLALAEWPANHFNYRATEIRQMLGMLDEAIADLRATSKVGRFDLALTTLADPARPAEPLLPDPTPKDAIEETLLAAQLTESAAERTALLKEALAGLHASSASLPAEWLSTTRSETLARLAAERRTDNQYKALTQSIMTRAQYRARRGDVRGVERLLPQVRAADETLGKRRPQSVSALVAAVRSELDAAQRLRLARDHWNLRLPAYRMYYASVSPALRQLAALRPALESIKSLSGSTAADLDLIHRTVNAIVTTASTVVPPAELSTAHAQLVSAAQLADNAARIRREAVLAEDMSRAWDASSAAAGALMLGGTVRKEIVQLLNPPRIP
ncbi:MAG TPA: hypothetical protein VL309_12020 [Vicinamibacterales bacterium]|jgi:hypothetical protein|nr:hypothetical protein [Vicinamibacterales bacterium]